MPLRDFMLDLRRSGAPGCWHVGDLAWTVYFLGTIDGDLRADLSLWHDQAGQLLGFAWFDRRDHFLMMQVRPGAEKWEIERQMLAGAARRCLAAASEERPATLKASGSADDPEQGAFLESLGFQPHPAYVHFTRLLAGPLPEVNPEGFVVRAVAGESELAERAAAHREAFHPSRLTEVQYRRLVQMPEYVPELDLVAAAPDGRIAAYCQCWLDPVNRVGEFEPVGTRPASRGRGLAKAVLAEGLRRMRARGMETAFVCTQHDNLAARALYRSAGFELTNADFDYCLPEPQRLLEAGRQKETS